MLCLNPYSPRYDALKSSDLMHPFNGVFLDPIVEEQSGRAYIPESDVERREQPFTKTFPLYDPVLIHLTEKYGTGQLTRFDMDAPQMEVRSP